MFKISLKFIILKGRAMILNCFSCSVLFFRIALIKQCDILKFFKKIKFLQHLIFTIDPQIDFLKKIKMF